MKDILQTIESLATGRIGAAGKSPVKDLGFISCANHVYIRHVPFYDPCLILVLSGRKTIYDRRRPLACDAGNILAVPAPASFDIRNEPDRRGGAYRALVIPFDNELLERLAHAHDLRSSVQRRDIGVLHFGRDEALLDSVRHYLASAGRGRLRTHRLMELLLLLVGEDTRLLAYALNRDSWGQRVRAVLATDLAHAWSLKEVCKRLATSESTLRRHLAKEKTSFRSLSHELRLTTALMQLLQTSRPVYRIAYDCGYQSVSRFSSNFHRRFGLPPRELRDSMSESEQKLTVSGQPLPA